MPHLVLTRDGETVAEADVADHEADAYAAAFPKAFEPVEYPKWIEKSGERVLVHSAEEEHADPAEAGDPAHDAPKPE